MQTRNSKNKQIHIEFSAGEISNDAGSDDPVLKTILESQNIASQTTFSRHISNFNTQGETKLTKVLKNVVAAYFENLIKKNFVQIFTPLIFLPKF